MPQKGFSGAFLAVGAARSGAVIGLTSIVNTFLHIRTIFCLSLVRVLTGFAFGVVVAVLALLVSELIYRLIKKRMLHV